MSAGTLIVAIIIVAIGAFWIFSPIMRFAQSQSAKAKAQKAHDELLTTYERILSAIRDLDEDYQTGKLDAQTYEAERAVWVERGVLILQTLEQTSGLPAEGQAAAHLLAANHGDTPQVTPTDDIEAAIAQYVQSRTSA